jgi:uncharacterized protein YbaP (TraB family)
MKKQLFAVLILFISVQSFAQKASKKVVNKNSLLWEISGKGLKSPSYLFGTYHLMGKNFLDTLPGVINALNQSKAVIGEVPFEGEMELVQKMMPFMMLQGNSLDKILTQAEYAEVDSFIRKKTPMQLSALNGAKPGAVQLTVLTFIVPKNISPENQGLDMYFQKQGKSNGKELFGFETVEYQAELIFNTPIERQKEMLLKTVRESDRIIKESQQLFDAYCRQDLATIEKLIIASTDYTPAEMDEMLKKRNIAWVKQIPAQVSKQPVFYAIGAAHLLGNDGLINLLKKEGYTVKPISMK